MQFALKPKRAPDPVDRHVGGRVRMRRLMLKMSQEALGDALGVTFQQVQKYEKGVNCSKSPSYFGSRSLSSSMAPPAEPMADLVRLLL
jgi:DNA-binding XRE family transcriptional regulator